MIDQQLIQESSTMAQQAVENAKPTKFSCVWLIENLLPDSAITKLEQYVTTVDQTKWATVPGQEHNNRQAIIWDADTVIEELHEVFNSLTHTINCKFAREPVNFIGLQLWVDGQGYTTGFHSDNATIDIACQIYLFENNKPYGTTFRNRRDSIVVPYHNNCGYLMINNVDPALLHSTTMTTPKNVTRHSLYAVWSRTAKQ